MNGLLVKGLRSCIIQSCHRGNTPFVYKLQEKAEHGLAKLLHWLSL